MKKILFISGSLRSGSYNTQLLRHAFDKLSESFVCSFLDYGDLPLLNQDGEFPASVAVKRVRKAVGEADALWIGSPEYNHSYSAAIKNLIDWLSRPVIAGDYSTAAVRGKLVAMSSAAGSSGGSFSLSKLRELLEMLDCEVLDEQTQVSLGSRFANSELVLNENEIAQLEKECAMLSKALKGR